MNFPKRKCDYHPTTDRVVGSSPKPAARMPSNVLVKPLQAPPMVNIKAGQEPDE